MGKASLVHEGLVAKVSVPKKQLMIIFLSAVFCLRFGWRKGERGEGDIGNKITQVGGWSGSMHELSGTRRGGYVSLRSGF